MSAPSDDGAPLDTEPTTPQRVSRFAGITARLAVWQQRGLALLERHRQRLLVDLGVRMYERDRDSAGSVVGSAIAFRLFLFFVPLLLLLVGVVGFLSALIDPGDISEAGISGRLATQIESALTQADSSRWVALAVGLIGLATTGRTLSKVLIQANCLAWRLPIQKKAPVRVIVAMVGLMFTVGVVTMVINRIRVDLGVGVASVSFLAACAVYIGAWGVLMVLLPRSTTDPGAVVPGAVLVGVTLTALQLVSQLYLPGRVRSGVRAVWRDRDHGRRPRLVLRTRPHGHGRVRAQCRRLCAARQHLAADLRPPAPARRAAPVAEGRRVLPARARRSGDRRRRRTGRPARGGVAAERGPAVSDRCGRT